MSREEDIAAKKAVARLQEAQAAALEKKEREHSVALEQTTSLRKAEHEWELRKA